MHSVFLRYGHVAVRYTTSDGVQRVMNILGTLEAEGATMINFVEPYSPPKAAKTGKSKHVRARTNNSKQAQAKANTCKTKRLSCSTKQPLSCRSPKITGSRPKSSSSPNDQVFVVK